MRFDSCFDLRTYLLAGVISGGIEELEFWFLFALLVTGGTGTFIRVVFFSSTLLGSDQLGGISDYLILRGSSSVYFQAGEWFSLSDEIRLFHLLPGLISEFGLIPGFGSSCYREDAGGLEC